MVTFPLSGDEIMAAPLFEEDLVLVLPPGHPLGAETSIPLVRLAELELLLPAPGTALRNEIDIATVPARVTLTPAMELDGVRLIASLAFDGYGPAILPATAVPGHLRGQLPRPPGRRAPPPPGRRGATPPRACRPRRSGPWSTCSAWL